MTPSAPSPPAAGGRWSPRARIVAAIVVVDVVVLAVLALVLVQVGGHQRLLGRDVLIACAERAGVERADDFADVRALGRDGVRATYADLGGDARGRIECTIAQPLRPWGDPVVTSAFVTPTARATGGDGS